MQSTTVPHGAATQPPGPDPLALLAGIDPTRVANADTVELLRAWRRVRSYVDAHELAATAELGRTDPHPHRR